MSLLGRFWPSERRRSTDPHPPEPGPEQGERPDDGPPTGPLAQAGPATGWFLRRRRGPSPWGSADDVELRPAPPPDARPVNGPDAAASVAGPGADTAFRSPGFGGPGFGEGPFGDGPVAARPLGDAPVAARPLGDAPNGDAPSGDAPVDRGGAAGRVPAGGPHVVPPPPAPGPVWAPPWRRPATPPWGLSGPTVSDGSTAQAAPTATRTPDRSDDLVRSASPVPVGALVGGGSASSALVAGSAHPMSSSSDDRRPGPVPAPGTDTSTGARAGTRAGTPGPTTTEDSMTAPSTTPPTTTPPTTSPAEARNGTADHPAAPTDAPAPAAPAAPTAPAAGPRHAVAAPDDAGSRVDRRHVPQARLGIDEVTPEVAGGRFPSKAVVGEVVPIGATVWREGHDAVAATLVWQRDGDATPRTARMVPVGAGTDRYAGHVVPDAEGPWTFRVDAWSDPWATWRHAVEAKVGAGQGAAELANDLENGARLLDRAADRPDAVPALATAAAALRDTDIPLVERVAAALAEPVHLTMTEQPVRELVTEGETHRLFVERPIALAGSWYEFFPRSTGGRDADGTPVHGTFATAARELDRVAAMGFDVAYLPPIHPVGTVNRKGPNNTLTPEPDDVGSPWAIGSADGGHDAVHPDLGTVDDFDAFVARAHELGLEVALDLALQCAPDHPWAATHPEWFVVRPDGTIAYAENPPKRYQDIYPVNFDTDPDGIYAEVLRVVLYWMEHGVRIFRVDNPHTKPPDFWCWLIAEVHRRDPGVVFLAEAFTRPARLFGLARAGFSQSYTYFTWRTGRDELREFFESHRDRIDECRPNCFVNTPDILHESLQLGGPGMFAIRAALAATLSPTWGVYSGFELFERVPLRPGSEEYLDSEKYQLRPRDFAGELAAGRSLAPWLTRLNQIRRAHPALRQIRTLRFHDVDNDALLAFSKVDPLGGDTVLGVVTLDPFAAQEGTVRLDMPALGLDEHDRFAAFDEVTGQTFDWGQANYVRLEPWRDVAHVVSVIRR